jgi:hypothetical protein
MVVAAAETVVVGDADEADTGVEAARPAASAASAQIHRHYVRLWFEERLASAACRSR